MPESTALDSLECPNCGAPLTAGPVQALAICLYCGSTIRIDPAVAKPQIEDRIDPLPPDTMDRVRRLLAEGRRAEAVDVYRKATPSTDQAEAEQAIDSLATELAATIVAEQQLSRRGLAVVGLAGVLLVGAVAAGTTRALPWWTVALVVFVALALALPLARGLRATLRSRGSVTAPARVLKSVLVGEVADILTFRLYLEVLPPGEPPFRAQTNLVMRRHDRHRLRETTRIRVRYRPEAREWVLYDGRFR